MNDTEQKLLDDRLYEKISHEELSHRFPQKLNAEYVITELNKSIKEKSLRKVETLFSYTDLIQDEKIICEFYQILLIEPWHIEHENIALQLQFHIKCPDSVDYLIKAMKMHHEHLVKSGDDDAFIRKCMYAIADLGTDYSKERLHKLSSSNDEIIKGYAKYQIERLADDERRAKKKEQQQSEDIEVELSTNNTEHEYKYVKVLKSLSFKQIEAIKKSLGFKK